MGTVIRIKNSVIKGTGIDFNDKLKTQGFTIINQNQTNDRLKLEMDKTLSSAEKTTIINYLNGLVHNDIEFDDVNDIASDIPAIS